MFCMLIAILLIICWLLTQPDLFTAGMGLRQPTSDVDMSDTKICQFNSALHAFILNRDLNKFAIEQLEKRVKHKAESYWTHLLPLLKHTEDSVVYKKITEPTHYLPIEVFGHKLCKVVDMMAKFRYGSTQFQLGHFLLAITYPKDYFNSSETWSNDEIINNRTPHKADYSSPYYLYGYIIFFEDEGSILEYYTVLMSILLHIDFECLFISYFHETDGHVYAITKTSEGFSFNDDGYATGHKFDNKNDMSIYTMTDLTNLLGHDKVVFEYVKLNFITKEKYDIPTVASSMNEWTERIYNKLDDKFKLPKLMSQNTRELLVRSMVLPSIDATMFRE